MLNQFLLDTTLAAIVLAWDGIGSIFAGMIALYILVRRRAAKKMAQ
jgi:hypothetical protein